MEKIKMQEEAAEDEANLDDNFLQEEPKMTHENETKA